MIDWTTNPDDVVAAGIAAAQGSPWSPQVSRLPGGIRVGTLAGYVIDAFPQADGSWRGDVWRYRTVAPGHGIGGRDDELWPLAAATFMAECREPNWSVTVRPTPRQLPIVGAAGENVLAALVYTVDGRDFQSEHDWWERLTERDIVDEEGALWAHWSRSGSAVVAREARAAGVWAR